VSTSPAPEGRETNWIVWGVVAVLVALAFVGVLTYSSNERTEEAEAKAQELTQKFEAAGFHAAAEIDQDRIVRSLGTDGGAVCDNPAEGLGKALVFDQLANGGSFVGRRPVIADTNALQGQALILETYCPEEIEEFREELGDIKTDDVIER
jgi:hypothetical protein